MGKLTKDNLFKPALSRTESRSKTTDEISRAITEDEVTKRERKSERLREIRLAKEAEERETGPADAPAKKKRTTGASGKKTARGRGKG